MVSIGWVNVLTQANGRKKKLSKDGWGKNETCIAQFNLKQNSQSEAKIHKIWNYLSLLKVLTYEMGILVWDPEGDIKFVL